MLAVGIMCMSIGIVCSCAICIWFQEHPHSRTLRGTQHNEPDAQPEVLLANLHAKAVSGLINKIEIELERRLKLVESELFARDEKLVQDVHLYNSTGST